MSWQTCDYCNCPMTPDQHGNCPRCGSPVMPKQVEDKKDNLVMRGWLAWKDGKYDRDVVLHEAQFGAQWMNMRILIEESKKAPQCRCAEQTIAVRWYDGETAHVCVSCFARYPPGTRPE